MFHPPVVPTEPLSAPSRGGQAARCCLCHLFLDGTVLDGGINGSPDLGGQRSAFARGTYPEPDRTRIQTAAPRARFFLLFFSLLVIIPEICSKGLGD